MCQLINQPQTLALDSGGTKSETLLALLGEPGNKARTLLCTCNTLPYPSFHAPPQPNIHLPNFGKCMQLYILYFFDQTPRLLFEGGVYSKKYGFIPAFILKLLTIQAQMNKKILCSAIMLSTILYISLQKQSCYFS